MTQRMIQIESPSLLSDDKFGDLADPSRIFGRKAPLALEIGCGIGDFVLEMARSRPDWNFLAVDIYNKGCWKTCKRIDAAGIDNVRVLRTEARYLMVSHLLPGSLDAVYVNCPDPWPKKRHRRRRLVNTDFLRMLQIYLRPGADFFFSTDVPDYAEEVAKSLLGVPGWLNALAAPIEPALPGYPLSKYMRRFLEQGIVLNFIHHRKDPAAAELSLPPVAPGFRISWSSAG